MKCRKVVKDGDHYNIIQFGSRGIENPYAIVFKEKENDIMPEVEINYGIYTNKITGEGFKIGNAIIKNIDIQNKKITYNFHSGDEYFMWEQKLWKGLEYFNGISVWSDGENIYYSNGSIQKVLNKETKTWEDKSWGNNFSNFFGSWTWNDGENSYYSRDNDQYVLDKETLTWIPKIWEGLRNFRAIYVWSDGEDIYYSEQSKQYKFNKETKDWENNDNYWEGMTQFYGSDIWSDGENIYYSSGSTQQVLDKETHTWSPVTWQGLPENVKQHCIWSDGENVYYSSSNSNVAYILDKENLTWSEKNWANHPPKLDGERIWTDGNNIYFSYEEKQYILNKSLDDWEECYWGGISKFNGDFIWTDGENIYYSFYELISRENVCVQRVLNKQTNTWEEKNWNGHKYINAEDIWSDGENIYYSSGSIQKVLNKETSTWSDKTWNGLENSDTILGRCVWKDGDNIYYSRGESQYVLDKSTSTWSVKSWDVLDNRTLNGKYIWSDGENIYYSYQDTTQTPSVMVQLMLNRENDSWIEKTWKGELKDNFISSFIWKDNKENIYYSDDIKQYVLDKESSYWTPKVWNDGIKPNGKYIWSDGENIYYSNGFAHYSLNKYLHKIAYAKVCYYTKDMFNANKTNLIKEITLEMDSNETSDKEASFDILMMSKKWNDGSTSYAEKQEGLASSLIQRLSIIKGELWYKINYGLPLFEKIKDKFIMDSIIVDIILSHPDVASIKTLQSSIENNTYTIKNLVVISIFNEEIYLY